MAGILAAAALWLRWSPIESPWTMVDLEVYRLGAEAVLRGADPYAVALDAGNASRLLFTYPPFALLMFLPLGALTSSTAAILMTSLSLVAFALAGYVAVAQGRLPFGAATLLLLGALALEPIQRTLLFGQINLVLMALVLADTLWAKAGVRGIAVGVAAAIKLTPAVFLIYFAFRRDWRAFARGVVAFLVCQGAAWFWVPSASVAYWGSIVGRTDRFGKESVTWGNQSVPVLLTRATEGHSYDPVIRTVVTTLALVAIFVWGMRTAHRLIAKHENLAAVTVIATVGLLLSPISWTHHWVWVVPMLVVLLEARNAVLFSVAALTFYLPPMWLLLDRGADGPYSLIELTSSGAFVLVGLAFLAAMTVWSHGGRRAVSDVGQTSCCLGLPRPTMRERKGERRSRRHSLVAENREGEEG